MAWAGYWSRWARRWRRWGGRWGRRGRGWSRLDGRWGDWGGWSRWRRGRGRAWRLVCARRAVFTAFGSLAAAHCTVSSYDVLVADIRVFVAYRDEEHVSPVPVGLASTAVVALRSAVAFRSIVARAHVHRSTGDWCGCRDRRGANLEVHAGDERLRCVHTGHDPGFGVCEVLHHGRNVGAAEVVCGPCYVVHIVTCVASLPQPATYNVLGRFSGAREAFGHMPRSFHHEVVVL